MDAIPSPVRAGTRGRDEAAATRWAVALLALATLLLVLVLCAVAAYLLLLARAFGADIGWMDLVRTDAAALAGLGMGVAAGWVVGVLGARALSRRVTWPPWATGTASALVGCAACALVLRVLGLV